MLWNELDSLCGFLMLERAPVEFTVNVLGQNSEPRLAARRHVYIEELLVASARGTAKKKSGGTAKSKEFRVSNSSLWLCTHLAARHQNIKYGITALRQLNA